MTKLFEKIKIHLTDAQAIELGDELAEKEVARTALEEEKSAALGSFNAKLKTADAEIVDLATQLNERVREQEVEVREEHDDGRNVVVIIRQDNGQVLRTRNMTLNEMAEAKSRLQGDLFGAPGSQAKRQDDAADGDADGEAADTDAPPESEGASAAAQELNGQPLVNARKGRRSKKSADSEAQE
jgi:hypothetical protein